MTLAIDILTLRLHEAGQFFISLRLWVIQLTKVAPATPDSVAVWCLHHIAPWLIALLHDNSWVPRTSLFVHHSHMLSRAEWGQFPATAAVMVLSHVYCSLLQVKPMLLLARVCSARQ